jgi:hypothetical protein
MSNRNFKYYNDRLNDIREVLDIMYKFAKKNNKNIIVYIREKFDLKITQLNKKILEEGLTLPNLNSNFVDLTNRYIKILNNIHSNKNNILLKQLKDESEVLDIEKMFNTLPEIPVDLPKIEKKKETLLN